METAINKALAIVIASTRKKKRPVDLLTISESFATLIDHYKSIKKVAKLAGVSSEMVREFLKIRELSESTKELVRTRKIDSVDLAYRLVRLSLDEQEKIAKKAIAGEMNTDVMRALISYKATHPFIDAVKIITRVEKSRNRRVYVAYFKLPIFINNRESKSIKNKRIKSAEIVKSRLEQFLGSENIEYFESKGEIAKLSLNLKGLNRLRQIKKILKASIKDAINLIITGKCSVENFRSHGAED